MWIANANNLELCSLSCQQKTFEADRIAEPRALRAAPAVGVSAICASFRRFLVQPAALTLPGAIG